MVVVDVFHIQKKNNFLAFLVCLLVVCVWRLEGQYF